MRLLAGLSLVVLWCGCQQAVDDAKQQATEVAQAAEDAAVEAKQAVSEGMDTAMEKASEALQGIEGGSELLTGFKDMFASASESLSEIKDQTTAEAASSKLEGWKTELEEMGRKVAELPADAQSAVLGVVKQGLLQLEKLIEKVRTLSGVEEAIGPQLDALLEQLKAMEGGS